MTDHLIGGYMFAVTPEQLARLPAGALVQGLDGWRKRWFPQRIYRDETAWLLLNDAVTRAILAACVVRPWIDRGNVPKDMFDTANSVCSLAVWLLPMTDEQLADFARLARTALDALTPPAPPPPPPQ